MIIDETNYLEHYGILRRSGRYPWGSGKDQAERNSMFLDHVDTLRKQGLSEVEIARGFGITTTQLRAAKSIAKNQQRAGDISMAQRLKDKGMSNVAIGERMGIPESTVRAYLAPGQKDKTDVLESVSTMLKDQVAQKTYIDIGAGVEQHLPVPGLSNTKLNTAVARLQEEGYTVHRVKIDQLGTGHQTEMKVLAPPGTTQKDVWLNRDKIKQVTNFTDDGGRSFLGLHEPLSISSKRLGINYAEDGGAKADGVIYVRPGVPDVSLGKNRYAQVRIAIDGTHYIKGMAMYKDDMPPGKDLVFNTNKSNTGSKLDALKPMKDDPDNPFGSVVRQIVEKDANGKEHVTSAMNLVNEQGDWANWSKTLSSQMLSKQAPQLAKQQLAVTYENKKSEFDEIMSLTNPAVKSKLLEGFAEDADSAAVHLKAASLRRTSQHVILPINSLKDTEIYAPNFNNGERVVLVRHPHGGIFEIPELTVNNQNPEAVKAFGKIKSETQDAVGINHKVAARLSGADFDGDTVLVIPNGRGEIKTAPALKGLIGFDPKATYPAYEGMPKVDPRTKQIEMGKVSNLITDMTIHGASQDELARAVRHSMVVIDAEKHQLNYKQSAIDNGIAQLKAKYQGGARGGASTLISQKKKEMDVPARKQGFRIDPESGRKIHIPTNETYVDRKTGEVKPKMQKVKILAETHDAHTLSSGTQIEKVYADHSNRLKALANQARLETTRIKAIPYSPSAKEAYAAEVSSLNSKLALAQKNRPLERQAQVLANTTVRAKLNANPDMEPEEKKKIKSQALAEMRTRTGAKKTLVEIEPHEWEAIQAGAISNSKLKEILDNADLDKVKALATPRTPKMMTTTKVSRAKSMALSGYTQAEIAQALGVSLTTLKNSLRDGG